MFAHASRTLPLPLVALGMLAALFAFSAALSTSGAGSQPDGAVSTLTGPRDTGVILPLAQMGGGVFAAAVPPTGSHAYISEGASLAVIDLATPAQPQRVAHLPLPAEVEDIALQGSTAYLAGLDAGLLIANVSQPLAPSFLGSYDTPGSAVGVHVTGTLAFVADNTATCRS